MAELARLYHKKTERRSDQRAECKCQNDTLYTPFNLRDSQYQEQSKQPMSSQGSHPSSRGVKREHQTGYGQIANTGKPEEKRADHQVPSTHLIRRRGHREH
ncbi:hypothetical protein D3C81_1888660 [compost metagenome]